MTVNNFSEKMNSAIDARMQNADWGLDIASRVIKKRNKKMKKIYTLSSFSVMATAAIIVFALFLNTAPIQMNEVELFVTMQVEETHKTVFKDDYNENLLSVSNTEDSGGSVDNLIYTALTMR